MAKKITNVEGQVAFDIWDPNVGLVIPEEPKVDSEEKKGDENAKKLTEEVVSGYYQALVNFLYADGKFARIFGIYGNLRGSKHLWSPSVIKTFQEYYEGNWQKLVVALNDAHQKRDDTLATLKTKAAAVGKPITEEVFYLLQDPVEKSERDYLRKRAKNGLQEFLRTGRVYSWGEMLRQRMERRRK